ncbi:Hypothetical predicted protein [Paramuricea clavata]|uniref:Hcy-binding domain-containing protein n=1 Tax=Paramuricea clavata TaxID=317549 RepID=A0A7D9D8I1_PARCT|nr:Hypothetical predicted protein [Paramuricea clavata]
MSINATVQYSILCRQYATVQDYTSHFGFGETLAGLIGIECTTIWNHTSHDDPLWSARALIDNPGEIKRVHTSFLHSGANIILTDSYQASIEGFCRHAQCTSEAAISVIKRSVSIAKEACQEFLEETQNKEGNELSRNLLVGGSVGPYGACQFDKSEYHGNYVDKMNLEELKSWHRPRIKILVEAGVDFLAVETIPALVEAEAILQVLNEFPSVICWVSFSCKDQTHLCHGEKFCDAVTTVETYKQVEAVGINCSAPEHVQGLLSSIHGKSTKPIVVYANNGQEWWKKRFDNNPDYISYVLGWLEQGAKIIGGCCGVTPADIEDIRNAIKDRLTTKFIHSDN